MGFQDRQYYRDDPPPGLMPSWNTKSPIATIIIVCVALFLGNAIFGGRESTLTSFLALYANDLSRPWYWWRLLSYGFVHDVEIGHIFWNMFGLWMLGRAVEDRYGWSEFWRIYLSSVVVCGIVWLVSVQAFSDSRSVIGASGAVCCIEMLFVLNYPRQTIMFFGIIPMPAWILGVMLVAGNILGDPSAQSNIAYGVHLTGIVFAFIYFYGNFNLGFLGSLSNFWRLTKRRMTGPKLKAYRPDTDADDAMEADRILDKIHAHGQDSLTRKERKFMEDYSRKMRERQK